MSLPKLTYFDFDGGRGEVARLAFAIGAVPFVDDRVPFAAWMDRKAHTFDCTRCSRSWDRTRA
jgi:prostaglandin-H2 D-isomerase / glutathione transferase